MIYTKLISGLGNQLFQYAVARQLSILNNAPLKLDISFYDSQNLRSYKLNHYHINAEVASQKEVDDLLYKYNSSSIPAKIQRKLEKLKPKSEHTLFKEEKWWHYEPELYNIKGDCYLEGYWQCHQYFENMDSRILDELQVKDTDDEGYAKIVKQLANADAAVSLHIRRGDTVTDKNANQLMGILPLEYYHRSINYITSKIDNPVYYIFSDDLNWAKENLHIEGDVVLVDIASGTKDYLELDLMGRCKHNVVANSTFSWWGAFMNRNPNKVVIAPDKWVLPPDINKNVHIQLPDWIKL